jgi:fructose-bisphosphate aldolase class II
VSTVPLVMHGGSGTPEDQVQNAIRHGITKLNVYADSRVAMFQGLKRSAENQTRPDPLPDVLFRPIREALSELVAGRIRIFFADNRVSIDS